MTCHDDAWSHLAPLYAGAHFWSFHPVPLIPDPRTAESQQNGALQVLRHSHHFLLNDKLYCDMEKTLHLIKASDGACYFCLVHFESSHKNADHKTINGQFKICLCNSNFGQFVCLNC